MNEEEWLSEMVRNQWMVITLGDLKFPRTKAGRRRLRLFACECCRVVWELLPDDRFRDAIQTAEAVADGWMSKGELEATREKVWSLNSSTGPFAATSHHVGVAMSLAIASTDAQAYSAAFTMTCYAPPLGGQLPGPQANAHLCILLRDIFGNPFRPVAFDPAWQTEHTTGIALKMYDDRDFAAMPILADALQEAGCEDADILTHCREPGVHVRGCWVVDLVLGKA